MNIASPLFHRTIAGLLLSSAVLFGTATAEVVSHSKNIVIEQPANLPDLAQRPGVALHLYCDSGDGRAYLYIEQQSGKRLVVLDVTDPARVRMVRTVQLSVPGPFDFVQPLRSSAVLARFRNNMGEAVLDLRNARMPVLRIVDGQQYSGSTEPLGDSALLMVNDIRLTSQAAPRDYHVVDTTNPASPFLLYTAKQVNSILTRNATGTTFLLGSDGLTIIRRPRIEDKYWLEQRAIY